jgi:hypothetical protein
LFLAPRALDPVVASHHVGEGGIFFVSYCLEATRFAGVVGLSAKSMGPTVVEALDGWWILGLLLNGGSCIACFLGGEFAAAFLVGMVEI